MDKVLKKFGERMRALREARGLSLNSLGKHIGVSKQTLSNWELGNSHPDIKQFIALCAYFGVGSEDLLGKGDALKLDETDATQIRVAASSNVVPLRDMVEGGLMLAGALKTVEPKKYIPTRHKHSRASCAFVVDAKLERAMGPKFRSGDEVTVDPEVDAEPGQAVLAMVGQDIVFRYYWPTAIDSSTGAELRARTPGWPPVIMGPEDKIVAVMVEHATVYHD